MASDQWLPIGSDVPAADEAPAARESEAPEIPSLAALIRAGDPDALLGFRDAHEPAVRAYMEETVCSEDRVDEAVDSSFTDMFGRLTADDDESTDLEALLLVSARSAAAGRFEVSSDGPHGPDPICLSVPELLAARDNGELESAEQLELHIERCPTCQGSAGRMREAERRFAAAMPGAAPAEPEATPEPRSPARSRAGDEGHRSRRGPRGREARACPSAARDSADAPRPPRRYARGRTSPAPRRC
jgi:hypothetical protein